MIVRVEVETLNSSSRYPSQRKHPIKSVCHHSNRSCVSFCRRPMRNCVKLGGKVERGDPGWFPEDPASYFIHWNAVLEDGLRRLIERTTERKDDKRGMT